MPKPITPLLTVDIIIQMIDRQDQPIVLIERKNPPPGWALPGGFVDVNETVETAAIREAKEETCLDIKIKHLLGVYSDPSRDPRFHTASVVYIAESSGQPRAADDAINVHLHNINNLPNKLAFDHSKILADYQQWLQNS